MNQAKINNRSERELDAASAEAAPVAPIEGFLTTVVRGADMFFGGRHALLLITATAILTALVTRFPHYENLPRIKQEISNQALSWQVRHPLTPIPANLKNIPLYGPPASHADKMELRLTLPLLGHLSGTGSWTIVIWGSIAGALLIYFFAVCARDAMKDTTATAFFVIGLAATFFGTWGFNDFLFGDAVAFDLMLLSVCFMRWSWLSGLCFLGAAFCDERTIVAAPLLLLYFIVRYSQPEEKKQRNHLLFAIVATIGVWLVLRWWLSATFHLSTGTSMVATWEIFRDHMTDRQTYLSVAGMFRASWIIPVLALRRLIVNGQWALAAALIGAFGVAAGPAFLVLDLNRSLGYAFLVFLISVRVLWHDVEAPKKYLAAIMLVNILLSPPSKTILRFLV